ncbi:MAG: cytochrome c [Planctomycetota bacterium]
MKKMPLWLACTAIVGLVIVLAAERDTDAGPKYQEIASVEQLMSGLVKPHATVVRKALREGPKDEKEWHRLEAYAAMIGEGGLLLNMGKRPKDDVWKKASVALAKSGQEMLKACKKKDLDAARAAVKAMGASCGSCHKKHKK